MEWNEEVGGRRKLLARPVVPPRRIALGWMAKAMDGLQSRANILGEADLQRPRTTLELAALRDRLLGPLHEHAIDGRQLHMPGGRGTGSLRNRQRSRISVPAHAVRMSRNPSSLRTWGKATLPGEAHAPLAPSTWTPAIPSLSSSRPPRSPQDPPTLLRLLVLPLHQPNPRTASEHWQGRSGNSDSAKLAESQVQEGTGRTPRALHEWASASGSASTGG